MPTTVNGIGTHYYGKKNLEKRSDTCQFCGNTVQLESYDTRLWFVLFFIPIIPLGRKRIIDSCPACTRHFAVDADKWETAKQLEVSGALDKYRSNPTPEAAMEAHQQLINFHQYAQADEFRTLIRQKHADNAKLQTYLGLALTHLGRLDEATACFTRALELRPDIPEARSGLAMDHIRHQRLDEARKLLDHLEKPGAEQLYSLEPLETLGRAYQAAGRHLEALDLFGKLLAAFPVIGENKHFRKVIETSEKALGHKDSLLPKLKFSWKRFLGLDAANKAPAPREASVTWRGLAAFGVVVAVILLLLATTNEYIRRHRTVHVVNTFSEPVTIEIKGETTSIRPGIHEIELAEGQYHATLTGPIRQEVDFSIKSGYFERWGDEPVWILNPGGNAVLLFEQVVYSANPRPGTVSFHFGEPFVFFPSVTHAFTPLPEKVQVSSSSAERTLTHLELFRGEPGALFNHLLENNQGDKALQLAEVRLRFQPDAPGLLAQYVAAALEQKKGARVKDFLRAGLTNRPVLIEWHRSYQGLPGLPQAALVAEYDALLTKEPGNSALLYLRGRLGASRSENLRWFEKAREADARNPYPYFALGYDRMAVGDFAEARDLLARAVELRPQDEGFANLHWLARVALGDFIVLEHEARQRMKANPHDVAGVIRLSDLLLARGSEKEAQNVVSAFEIAASAKFRGQAADLIQIVRRYWLYSKGDFAGLEASVKSDRSSVGDFYRFVALLEQGRADEALAVRPLEKMDSIDGFDFLGVALALRHAGHPAHAAWEARGLQLLDASRPDEARAAALLRNPSPPGKAELDEVAVPVNEKTVLLALLALKHPSDRARFAAAAQHLNLHRSFPHHLVRRIAGAAKP
ncbi:MAG: tetratricopeptide repeat protein [Verrucomicrobiota bacterium]